MRVTFRNIVYWAARLLAAFLLLQTLYFKFTGASESIYIFAKVGMEPWGRIGTGIVELIASLLIIFNRTAWIGALLALGVMAGAILMHLTVLGIVVQDDGGRLFIYAWLVTLSCLFILIKNKGRVQSVLRLKKSS